MNEINRIHLRGWKSGCAVFLFCAVATMGLSGQTFRTLVNFTGINGTGASAPTIQAFDGNYYGTTGGVGANCQGSTCGTIYRLSAGKLTTLYTFCLQSGCPDGNDPGGTLIQASDGNLYGTTYGGGSNGGGTFFRMSLAGKLTTLYNFCAPASCGYGSVPLLIQGSDGSFYGTTQLGGANGYGAIVKISSTGKLTTLHSFTLNDGASPIGGLIQGANGNLYGTTSDGGNFNCVNWFVNFWGGCGTIFELTPKGRLSTLYSFCPFSCSDGAIPQGTMIEGGDGNLYGTTHFGGFGYGESQCDPVGCGTIFKFTAQGQLTPLYTFCTQNEGMCTDGFWPAAGLTVGNDGNFYGSATNGGLWTGYCTFACGTLFSVTPGGVFSVLHNFLGTDGSYPGVPPMQATNGVFLGSTSSSGAGNDGTLYSLSMNLPAFVETNPASGTVGTTVVIMGNSLKGSTAVTFNGTAAKFRVAANSAIVATVPTGATSGLVSVTTLKGTFTSNVAFTVRP